MTHTSSSPRTVRRFQPASRAGAHGSTATHTPTAEIVIPVHNEERALPGCIRTLHTRLRDELPYPWRITVADNASRGPALRTDINSSPHTAPEGCWLCDGERVLCL
jgi:hypothetical protein